MSKNEYYNNNLNIGDRIIIHDGRQATIKFIGHVKFASGIHIGIVLDKPSGKHDGRFNGRRYFHCNKFHGLFIKPCSIQSIIKVYII